MRPERVAIDMPHQGTLLSRAEEGQRDKPVDLVCLLDAVLHESHCRVATLTYSDLT